MRYRSAKRWIIALVTTAVVSGCARPQQPAWERKLRAGEVVHLGEPDPAAVANPTGEVAKPAGSRLIDGRY